ncbi:unnamed protein product [Meganyctiphanes norvegica]|uniref:Uncharacterized protein n=1 Tax=Meganyctiphanes norvegica TaxID=48144 RepID=A0AAV2PX55_MEGNR
MDTKGTEAAASAPNAPRVLPRFQVPPPPPSSPPPSMSTPTLRFTNSRTGHGSAVEVAYNPKTARHLSRVNLIVAVKLFVCQVVAAGCLCRPMIVMGGLWIALFILTQAVVGLKAAENPSHGILVGHAWLSGLVAIVTLASAGYLFSGHVAFDCISIFHARDQATVIRLYVVEVVGLVATVPCLIASVVCILGAFLAVRAVKPPKVQSTGPMIFYLPRWNECNNYKIDAPIRPDIQAPTLPTSDQNSQSHESNGCQNNQSQINSGENIRAPSPPPSYCQVAEESYA